MTKCLKLFVWVKHFHHIFWSFKNTFLCVSLFRLVIIMAWHVFRSLMLWFFVFKDECEMFQHNCDPLKCIFIFDSVQTRWEQWRFYASCASAIHFHLMDLCAFLITLTVIVCRKKETFVKENHCFLSIWLVW